MKDWPWEYLGILGKKHPGHSNQRVHGRRDDAPTRARSEFSIPRGHAQDGKVGKYKTGSFAIITRPGTGRFGHIIDFGHGGEPVITLPMYSDRPTAVESAKVSIDKDTAR